MASQADLDQNRAVGYQTAVAILCSFATVVVLLRLLSRKVSDVNFWWDDAFIVIATLFAWATAAALFWGVSAGLGKSNEALDFQASRTLFHIALLLREMYYCCITFIKFSILTFYRRIFPINTLRFATYALIGIILIWCITCALIDILNCTPISYNWDRTQSNGHCLDPKIPAIAISIPNIVTDVIILLLPLPTIWKLRLHFKKKMALSAIFSVGIFVTVASCIRLVFVTEDHNGFGDAARPFLWTNIEPEIAIVCACLPTMMPLFRLVREKVGSKFTLPRIYSKAASSSKSQWSRSKNREPALNTDRDGFTHLVDGVELSTATSWAWRGSLPDDEAARSAEEGLAMGKVHIRNDVNVSHDQI